MVVVMEMSGSRYTWNYHLADWFLEMRQIEGYRMASHDIEIYWDGKCERETVWEEGEGGDWVVYFGQVEFHMLMKCSNGNKWLDTKIWTSWELWAGNINVVVINIQMTFKAIERKRPKDKIMEAQRQALDSPILRGQVEEKTEATAREWEKWEASDVMEVKLKVFWD